MSNTATEPAFAGKDAGTTCPNCGRPLFSGLAEGNVLVCRDADGYGCQLAVDPAAPEGETMATMPTRMEDVVPSPEVGPPNENEPSTESDEQIRAAANQAWEPPTSAPQAQNFNPDEAVPAAPVPAPAPTRPAGSEADLKKSEQVGSDSTTP